MQKKKETNKGFHMPLFYVIYLVVTAIAILFVMIALGIVKSWLAEYEAAQPKYVAEEVFERYFEPIDYIALLTDADYDAGEVAIEDLADYINDEIGGEQLTYSVGTSNDPNEIKYIVKAASKQLAAIMLKNSGQKTEHGFQTYEFSRIELYLNMEAYLEELSKIVVTLDVPAAYSVTVDGEPLTAEFVTNTYTRTDIMKYYPPDVPNSIEYAVYTVTTLHEPPKEVVVIDPEGVPAEVSFDEDTHTYTCSLVYNEKLEEEYSEFVISAMERYAAYVQNSKNIGLKNIKGYFDTNSDAYADVVAAGGDRWMVRAWSGIDFEDVNIGEFYVHTPEIFSCHISLTQHLHQDGREDFVDVIDMYVFLHLTDQGYKIYDWFNA